MSYYPEADSHLRVQVVLYLWNYAIKKELNNATDTDTSNLATKTDFTVLEAKVNKLGIGWLVNVSACLNSLKTKVDDLDVGKSTTVPVNLKKVM